MAGFRKQTLERIVLLAVTAMAGTVVALSLPSAARADGDVCDGATITHRVGADGQVTGTNGDDVILGSDGPDRIEAGAGDDLVCGLGGDDEISGGAGADRIFAGSGDDIVRAGSGDDDVRGGEGDDDLRGGDGADLLVGDAGPTHRRGLRLRRESQRCRSDRGRQRLDERG